MFFGSVQIISCLDSQSKFQMFALFSGRYIGGTQSSTNVEPGGGGGGHSHLEVRWVCTVVKGMVFRQLSKLPKVATPLKVASRNCGR